MTRMASVFIGAGALGCLVGVIAGAFGAHALEHSLTPERLVTWGKGVDYLFIHALGLILVGVLDMSGPRRCHRIAGAFMMAGTVLFSGSLFLLVLLDAGWLGAVTPFGGVSFVVAWMVLAICHFSPKPQ